MTYSKNIHIISSDRRAQLIRHMLSFVQNLFDASQ